MADTQASGIIKEFLIALHKSYLPNVEAMRDAAKALGLSLSTINQATTRAKGSATTHLLLACYGLGLKPEDLQGLLPKARKIFRNAEKFSTLDERLQKVLKVYSVDEVIVFMETMLAKDKIERSLGVKKRPGRPSKQEK